MRHRLGSVAFAFVDDCGRTVGLHPNRVYVSASLVKAMLLVAYLRGQAPERALGPDERTLLASMIERSDNKAADQVFATVGEAGLQDLAAAARMKHFVSSPSWGGSGLTAADQARFMVHVERWVPERHEGYVLRLLAGIIDEQRWGIPDVTPRGWRVHFKSGWYPVDGEGWRVNQAATLRTRRRALGIAVLSDGVTTLDYGAATIRGIGRRLLAGYALRPESKRSKKR